MSDLMLVRPFGGSQGWRRRRWLQRLMRPRSQAAVAGRSHQKIINGPGARLLDAYAASLVEVACRAGELGSGRHQARVEAHRLAPLVATAVAAASPLAQACSVTLVKDGEDEDGMCLVDPNLFVLVLEHLLLEALSREASPGHIRLNCTVSTREARLDLLSPAIDCPERSMSELADAVEVLAAMGARLVEAPRRDGPPLLSLHLGTPQHAASILKAA